MKTRICQTYANPSSPFKGCRLRLYAFEEVWRRNEGVVAEIIINTRDARKYCIDWPSGKHGRKYCKMLELQGRIEQDGVLALDIDHTVPFTMPFDIIDGNDWRLMTYYGGRGVVRGDLATIHLPESFQGLKALMQALAPSPLRTAIKTHLFNLAYNRRKL